MDKRIIFQESKDHLAKINQFYSKAATQGKLTRLDFDLMLEHVRGLYDCLLDLAPGSAQAQSIPEPEPSSSQQNESILQNTKAPSVASMSNDVSSAPMTVPAPEPISNTVPEPVIPQWQDLHKPSPIVTQKVDTIDDALPVSAINPTIDTPKTNLDFLSDKKSNEVNDQYQSKPIVSGSIAGKDLHKMISVNERVIFLSELFSGNHLQMETAINKLNSAQHKSDAMYILHNELKTRFQWTDDNEGLGYLIKLLELKFE